MREFSLPLGLSLALLCLTGCGALIAPVPEPLPTSSPERSPRSEEVKGFDQVEVRLSTHEGRDRVFLEHSLSGSIEVCGRNGLLHAAGRESSRRMEFKPRDAGAGIKLGERRYLGRLRLAVGPKGSLEITNIVDLEDYIEGVVSGELVLWSALPAEIEAQAIAARTYAVRRLSAHRQAGRAVFLWDDVHDQVYPGVFQAGSSAGAQKVKAKLKCGVRASSGLVLSNQGALSSALFHASCGGWTTSPAAAFPERNLETRGSVSCTPCAQTAERELAREEAGLEDKTKVLWGHTISAEDLARTAQKLEVGAQPYSLQPVRVDQHGRWQRVELAGQGGSAEVEMSELRLLLGAGELKSGLILASWPKSGSPIEAGLYLRGLGRGHGAGLCQVGSHALAKTGWSAARILSHYYPGSELRLLSTLTAPAKR